LLSRGETPHAKNRAINITVTLYARVLAERLFKVLAVILRKGFIILILKRFKTKKTAKIVGKIQNRLLGKKPVGLTFNFMASSKSETA
jgi:hypothetical protein